MSAVRFSRNAFSLIALCTTLAACGGDDPTGLDGDALDVTEVTQQQAEILEALEAPVLYSILGSMDSELSLSFQSQPLVVGEPVVTLDRARPLGMASNGSALRAAVRAALASSGIQANAAEPGEEAEWFVDPEVWGNTYTKNAEGFYEWDANRTDAPARGVRIVLYQRTGVDTHNATVVGSLDAIDSSTTAMTVGRINIRDAQGQLVGSFRETSSRTGTGTVTVSETFTGTLGVAPKVFTVADTISGTETETADDYSTNLRWRSVTKAPFANAEMSMLITGLDYGDETEASSETIITIAGRTTRMTATSSAQGVTTSRVYIDDDLVATITYNHETEEETVEGPNGGELSQKVEQYLTAVTHTAAVLPNALVLRFVLAFTWMFAI